MEQFCLFRNKSLTQVVCASFTMLAQIFHFHLFFSLADADPPSGMVESPLLGPASPPWGHASGFSPKPARVQRGSAPALGHSSTSWVSWSCWKCVPLPVGQASSLFPNPWAKDPALPGQGETRDVLLSFGFRLTRCDKVVSVSVWSGIPSAHSALWLSSLASTNVPDS